MMMMMISMCWATIFSIKRLSARADRGADIDPGSDPRDRSIRRFIAPGFCDRKCCDTSTEGARVVAPGPAQQGFGWAISGAGPDVTCADRMNGDMKFHAGYAFKG